MLTQLVLGTLIEFFNAMVSWLPQILTLPTVLGFDLDSALILGIGEMTNLFNTFWPLAIIFQGFLVLLAYYSIKMLLRLLLGHRAPGTH